MINDDFEKLKKAKKGDREAITYLFEKHKKTAYSIAYRILMREDVAEDIVMDAFIKIFQNRFQINASFSAYLYRTVVNLSVNQIKKEKKENISLNDFQYDRPSKDNTEQEIEKKELSEKIKEALNKIPINQKTAFLLIVYEEMSYKEVSSIMHLSVKAVESLMSRAKTNLKKILSQEGY